MKVLNLSNKAFEGGAARATLRLQKALCKQGVDSITMARHRSPSGMKYSLPVQQSPLVRMLNRGRLRLDTLPLRFYKQQKDRYWSLNWVPSHLNKQIRRMSPDIVHLNWIGDGFISMPDMGRIDKPVVITLRDMWGLTGGCHYAFDCDRWLSGCGRCPQLSSSCRMDVSSFSWKRKKRAFSKIRRLAVVGLSRWVTGLAEQSPFFSGREISTIPNPIDLEVFCVNEKTAARNMLSLPLNRKIILFGADNALGTGYKGFHLLVDALRKLPAHTRDEILLVVFGDEKGKSFPDLPYQTVFLGKLSDDHLLNLAYSAADVFVGPSMQEALGNTFIEAGASGTPSVAFRVGGIPDIVEHMESGFLATPFSTDELAEGIAWVINDERKDYLAVRAREIVANRFSEKTIAGQYIGVYERLLAYE